MSTSGVKSGQRRASGETVTEEVVREDSAHFDEPVAVELPEDRERKFRTPGFARMRIDWASQDRPIVVKALAAVEGRILHSFGDAYQVMHDVFEIVRTPEVTSSGEICRDQYGFTIWKRTVSGGWEEDYSRLTRQARENFLYQITTRIFDWEQRAADVWGEAMFAKAQWEERFSIGFDAPMSGTVDDRRAAGNLDARDERYFAIFASLYSRRADAVVRAMNLLGQRLKDTLD